MYLSCFREVSFTLFAHPNFYIKYCIRFSLIYYIVITKYVYRRTTYYKYIQQMHIHTYKICLYVITRSQIEYILYTLYILSIYRLV